MSGPGGERGLSVAIEARARRNSAAIRAALTTTKQEVVAELVGVDKSTITRFRDDHVDRLSAVLAACGLKVVREDLLQIERAELEALKYMAGKGVHRAGGEPSVMGGLGE